MEKRLFLITCFLFSIILSIWYTSPVYAETEEVTLVLHKVLLGDNVSADEGIIQNDGRISPDGLALLKNQIGLNDVEFAFYDVTDDFYLLRDEGESVEDAQKVLSQEIPLSRPVITGKTQSIGTEDGVLSVNLPSKNKERDAVYLIKETHTPERIKNASRPMVVVLPILYDDQPLDIIHLFVKNERETLDQPTLEKNIIQDTHAISYGDKVTYTIDTIIPQDILKYETYGLEDEADPSLWLIKKKVDTETLKINIEGESVTDFYQITDIRDHGFTIAFDPKKLGEFPNKTIRITYDMELRGEALSDNTEFINRAVLIPGNEPNIKAEKAIYTGGYHFIKLNLDKQEQGLSGAEFIIKNTNGDFLKEMPNGGHQWVKNKKSAMRLISDDRGNFNILGLDYGDYVLEEVKAPNGYILNNSAVSFAVTKESYQETKVYPLKILNKLDYQPPRNQLPQTNDTYKPLVSIIGVCFIGLIITFKRRRKKQ